MGINQQTLKAILAENQYRKLSGNILVIGKSTVCVDKASIAKLFLNHGLTSVNQLSEIDKTTKHSSNIYNIDDSSLIKALSNSIESVDTLDISPYEGANIIQDMNKKVDKTLFNKYDFIYDSSVLDNTFIPCSFIVNSAAMLKPGGRIISINIASFQPGAMVSVHPEWFYGFYALNKFKDCKVYLTQQHEAGRDRFNFDADLWEYTPSFTKQSNYNYLNAVKCTNGICYTIVIAEKHNSPTSDLSEFSYPTNLQYIPSTPNAQNWSSEAFHAFTSDRPKLSGEYYKEPVPHKPHLTDHYTYLGSNF